ncbi:precorrin-6A/cobalt-precorrin-6A reductase [Aquimarina sp. I32.4]|uniref:precorrin-6A/cobalt-precorrin-6A reductase n=1 Tax=Aquimarina sp. I32.4 TaxID=2053903 RepID=UPI000CDE8653|nr:precorrin-6A/cobalt-precorrin-6A reductase [Aquimarina sp. I32.4]
MILVFGGTTEGKQVAKILDELQSPYYYSTKTKVAYTGKGTPIHGAMTREDIENFCHKHTITHIINASHPFAVQLHQTIAALSLPIPLIRFNRKFAPRVIHPLVTYVDSFEEAIAHFKTKNYHSLLALSGVQTIEKLKTYWRNYTTWFRILDRDTSRVIAHQANFPEKNLLYGYPQTKDEEIELFNKLAPDVILTKESGSNGKLDQKIAAAQAVEIPIVILKKPKLSNRYLCIDTTTKLIDIVS